MLRPWPGATGPWATNNDFQSLLEKTEDVKPGHVTPYPGSGTPLANLVPAFTSPTRSWVVLARAMAMAPAVASATRFVQVPLRKDYSHDVEAMIKADPNAGVYYICNPNNPTRTLTPRKVSSTVWPGKKKDAVLIIDEAYIHFSGRDNMSTDLVKADKDVIVLRTFSKIYGMAGLRAGMAYGRPDLLEQLGKFGRSGNLSVATMACAAASLKAGAPLMKERIEINKKNRDLAFEHIEKVGASYVPSVSNFFMLAVKRYGRAAGWRCDGERRRSCSLAIAGRSGRSTSASPSAPMRKWASSTPRSLKSSRKVRSRRLRPDSSVVLHAREAPLPPPSRAFLLLIVAPPIVRLHTPSNFQL